MAAIFMNNGLHPLNVSILGGAPSGDWKAHLFTNVVTPAATDTTATYTEMGGTPAGYTSGGYDLAPGTWTGSATAGVDTETYPSITVTFGATGSPPTIYGYYITITVSATTYLVCAENFAASYPIPAGGGALVVNLTQTLQKH